MRASLFCLSLIFLAAVGASESRAQAPAHRVEILTRGLENPWAVAFLPDGRALVTERPGRLRLYADGALSAPLAGVAEVWARGQGGLLDVAVDPDFARTGFVYFTLAAPSGNGALTRLARARLDGTTLRDWRTLLDAGPAGTNGRHFGARIVFGADGMLYMSTGDRGEDERAQRPGDLAGKVVRLAPDGRVPRDNPFVGRPGFRPEIYSLGHRNAQGFARDPRDGALWSTEHGPRGEDELNLVKPGRNYGWPIVTRGRDYGTGRPIGEATSRPGMEDAVHYWEPMSPAPSGLAVYDGAAFPAWRGDLLAGMLQTRAIHRLTVRDGRVTNEERLAEGLARIRDVRVGPDGFVYFLTDERDGALGRIVPAN
ncbi:MAG: PQQ-dependent sugar dehydrogenase [Tagaea sp.]